MKAPPRTGTISFGYAFLSVSANAKSQIWKKHALCGIEHERDICFEIADGRNQAFDVSPTVLVVPLLQSWLEHQLSEPNSPKNSCKPLSNFCIQDVESREPSFGIRKLHGAKQGQEPYARVVILSKIDPSKVVNVGQPSNNAGMSIDDLRMQVNQEKSTFPHPIFVSDIVSSRGNSICLTPQPINGRCRCSGNEDAKRRNDQRPPSYPYAPRLPPHNAVPRQRPALAHSIQHAHSLIPLWIGRHSAMRARARAASPQGVKDAG